MKKVFRIILAIISITLIIQLGTMTLTNKVYADVGNFKSYKSKGNNSSTKKSKPFKSQKKSYKSNNSNSSSQKNHSKIKTYINPNNKNINSINTEKSQKENKDYKNTLYPILAYSLPFLMTRNGQISHKRALGIIGIAIIAIIIAIKKGKS